MLVAETKFEIPERIAALPDTSRVWVYKADRELRSEDVTIIREVGQEFAKNWVAHGQSLAAAMEVVLDRFIIIAVDEEVHDVSGCSIDSSVGFIKTLESKIDVQFMDRMVIWYESDGDIVKCRTAKFKQLIEEGVVNGDTIVYNDLVSSIKELRKKFRVPAKESWHATLF